MHRLVDGLARDQNRLRTAPRLPAQPNTCAATPFCVAANLSARVPFTIRKRGIIAPSGTETLAAVRYCVDNTMVKALPRGSRWRKLLEAGVYGTIEEIAAAEKINASYVGRLLRLTLLAPEIVETILEGRQPVEMSLAALMRPFPINWDEQRGRTGHRSDQSGL